MKTNYDLFRNIMNTVEDNLKKHIHEIETYFQSGFIYIDSDINNDLVELFTYHLGWMFNSKERKQKLTIFINSNGGLPEVVFKLVKVIRDNFQEVSFIVKNALSAATLFCLSGDKLYVGLFTKMGDLRLQITDGSYNYQFNAYLENELKHFEYNERLTKEQQELILNIKNRFQFLDNIKNQNKIIETALMYLKLYMFKEYDTLDEPEKRKIEEIPKKLIDSDYLNSIGCFTHSTGLYWNDLKVLGLKIQRITELDGNIFRTLIIFSDLVSEFKKINNDDQFYHTFLYSRYFSEIKLRNNPNRIIQDS